MAGRKGSQNRRPIPLSLPAFSSLSSSISFERRDVVRAFPIGAPNPVISLVIHINVPDPSVMVTHQIQGC